MDFASASSLAKRGSFSLLFVALALFGTALLRPAVGQSVPGTWYCTHGPNYSCQPDGVGRGAEDFWTFYTLRKFGVWCSLSDTVGWHEYCTGIVWFGNSISYWQVFGASLQCPDGTTAVHGQCLKTSDIAVDQTCPMSAGNPVDILSGRKHETIQDWSSAGKQPLTFERYYSSYTGVLAAPTASSLGTGWRSNFDAAARWDTANPSSSSRVNIVLPNGFEYGFALQSGVWKSVLPRWIAQQPFWNQYRTDIDISLTADSSGGVLRMQDGRQYVFDAAGQLSRIIYSGGYAQSLSYSAGKRTRVSDNLGRWMTFSYGGANTPDLLTSVKTSDGKTLTYSYDKRLLALDAEAASKTFGDDYYILKSVTYPDNTKQVYDYLASSSNFGPLTSITDQRGVRYAEWTYDGDGRATSSQHAGGADRWLFAYDDVANTVTVTNPLGRQTVYTYRRVQGMIRQLISVKGVATTSCVQSDTSYAYDANGFRSQATDAEGRITRWTRNSRGLPLTETEAYGTAAARTRTMEWDATRPLPTRIAEPNKTTDMAYDAQGLVTRLTETDTTNAAVPYATKGQSRTTTYSYIALTPSAPPPAAIAALAAVPLAVVNPSAASGMTGWTVASGQVTSLSSGYCSSIPCFVAAAATTSSIYQDIAIPAANQSEVDAGMRDLTIGWRDYMSANKITVDVTFLNSAGVVVGGEPRHVVMDSLADWATRSVSIGTVPARARKIRITFTSSLQYDALAGLGAQGYWTNVTAQLTPAAALPPASVELLSAVDGPLPGSADTTGYGYDTSGNLISVTDELGHVTRITRLDAAGRPLSVTDANGVVTAMAYDARGRLTSVTANPGATQARTLITYDAAGQVTRVTAPDNSYLQYTWNDARRLTSIVNNGKERIDYAYNANGDVISRTVRSPSRAIVRQQSALFDELGRLMRSIGAAGQQTLPRYDRTDNLTQVQDPRGGLFGYAYDALQNLASLTDQAGGSVTLTRDGQGAVAAYSDPRGLTTAYVRNGFGEIIQESGPDVGTTVILRDERGLATQITDPRGVVTTLTYDAAGRLVQQAYPADPTQNVTYFYDDTSNGNKGIGRLTGITDASGALSRYYDALGRVIAETRMIGGKAYSVSYSYNAADRLTSITYPSGRIVNYSRDALGRVAAITTQQSASATPQSVASAIGWSPMSRRLTALTHGNGLTTARGYDGDGRLVSLRLNDGTNRVADLSYAYGDGMNLTAVNDNVAAANSVSLAYDAAQRLAAATGPWGSLTYGYTPNGDRAQESLTPPGGSALTTVLSYPATSNRLASTSVGGFSTRSFSYDAAGNLLTQVMGSLQLAFEYNLRNRPVTVTRTGDGTQVSTYVYNALEQMVQRTTTAPDGPVGAAHYIYGLDGSLLAVAVGATGSITREYIWLPQDDASPAADNDNEEGATPSPLPVGFVTGVNSGAPKLLMAHADHLGRPIRLTDATRATVWSASYDPFGQPWQVTGTVTQNLRFPGQFFLLESDLSYNWNRFYDAATGRYTQPDPLRFVDGPSVYRYASASPMMRVDPEGRQTLPFPLPLPPPILPLPNNPYNPPKPVWPFPHHSKGADGAGGGDGGGDDRARCEAVKENCYEHCSDMAIDNCALPDRQSMNFPRCINQCLFDNDCGGQHYSDGWDNGNIGTPRPWQN